MANKKSVKLNINSTNIETIDIKLTKSKFPNAYNAKLEELMENGLTKEDAEDAIKDMVFTMELVYHKNNGLFLVESDAIDCETIYSPYNGTACEVE